MKKKRAGETILEVLVATVILVGVLTASFSLLNRGARVNVNFERRSVALNIAGEGMEAVRNIRDTNWLKYSGDRRNKWLCLDSEADPEKCVGENPMYITSGFYQVEFSENRGRYFLTKIDGAEELDIGNGSDEADEFALFRDAATNRLTHISLDNTSTPFYRQVQLTPVSSDVCPLNNCTEKKLEVISRVQWHDASTTENVILETQLFDFFERDEY